MRTRLLGALLASACFATLPAAAQTLRIDCANRRVEVLR